MNVTREVDVELLDSLAELDTLELVVELLECVEDPVIVLEVVDVFELVDVELGDRVDVVVLLSPDDDVPDFDRVELLVDVTLAVDVRVVDALKDANEDGSPLRVARPLCVAVRVLVDDRVGRR